MNSSNIVVRGFFLSGAVSVNCYLLSFLQPLVVVFSCRQQRYYAASLLILATVSWRMDFESSPFHVENRRLITVLFTSSAAFSLSAASVSTSRLLLSHKDNAVTTQGSYRCGIHTFSSKMAAHEIRKKIHESPRRGNSTTFSSSLALNKCERASTY